MIKKQTNNRNEIKTTSDSIVYIYCVGVPGATYTARTGRVVGDFRIPIGINRRQNTKEPCNLSTVYRRVSCYRRKTSRKYKEASRRDFLWRKTENV